MQNINIVYEDNHIIILNKLPGQLSQGDKTGDGSLIDFIKDYIRQKYNKQGNIFLGVLHRLDRVSSGLIIYCKTSKALTKFNEILKSGQIKKTYLCITNGIDLQNSATLTHYLKRNPKSNTSVAHNNEVADSKKAVMEYEVLEKINKYSLLSVNLITGRHHQIRAQLKKIGATIKGDVKYGDVKALKGGGILLHSYRLQFHHPIKDVDIDLKIKPIEDRDSLWGKFEFIKSI